jgi:tetratricopeptide (TPR) repeat protein
MRVEKTVFISYRRTNIYHARAIYLSLTARGYDAFMDYESIDSGAFERIILREIDARAHFLVVLTPSALERCTDPTDWLRREIERAIEMQRNIVPLMFDAFSFGAVEEYLTGKLALLKAYNGLEVPASYFDEAMDRLTNRFLNTPLDMVLHPTPPANRAEVAQRQAEVDEMSAPTIEQVKAAEYYEKGVACLQTGDFANAIEDFSQAISYRADFLEAYYRRGHAYRAMKNNTAAIRDWEEAIRLASTNDPRVPFYRSNILCLKKDFDRALVEATEAVRLNPTDPEVYRNRGFIFRVAGDLEQAIADQTEALRLNPQDAIAYYNRGVARRKQDDYDAAIADYTEAVRLNPQYAQAYTSRGWARYEQGDYDGAISDFEEALRINPDYTKAKQRLDRARAAKRDSQGG